MMLMAQRSDAPEDTPVAPGERSTLFAARSPLVATVSAIFVVAGLVFIGWTTAPEGKRGAAHLQRVLFDLGRMTTENGWVIIALSVSLVAIVVTIITIIGLRDPENDHAQRRDVVMRIADALMLTALGFLAGVLVSASCSYLAISWRATVLDDYYPSTDLFAVFSASLLLWFVFSTIYRRLREIALSDAERREEDLAALEKQKLHFETRKSIADTQLSNHGKSQRRPSLNPRAARRGTPTPRKTLGMTVGYSALWILAASVVVVILLWVRWDEQSEHQHLATRTIEVLLAAMFIATMQMLFPVISYLWSIQHLQSGDPGLKGKMKAFGSFLFTTPMTLLVPLATFLGIFNPDVDRPLLLRIGLSALVLAPLALSFFLPRRWNWRRVSWSYASQQITRRLTQIEERIAEVDAEAASVKRSDHRSENERIIELLEQLVAIRPPSTPPGDHSIPSPSAAPPSALRSHKFWASLTRRASTVGGLVKSALTGREIENQGAEDSDRG